MPATMNQGREANGLESMKQLGISPLQKHLKPSQTYYQLLNLYSTSLPGIQVGLIKTS